MIWKSPSKMKTIFSIVLCMFVLQIVSAQQKAKLKQVNLGINFTEYVSTNNPGINKLRDSIYQRSVINRLYQAISPLLPNNWFSPGGGYVGQWIWDTMFQLISFAPLNQDALIRQLLENYWCYMENDPEAPKGSYRYGMVPNYIGPNNKYPLAYSQIPILAWGCWMVYQQTNDIEMIRRSLPFLISFDNWYSTERDIDNDGLIEYGSYETLNREPVVDSLIYEQDMIQAARFETFDFHASLDHMKMTKNPNHPGGKWYGNVEGVEQTCFLLMSEEVMIKMAMLLGEKEIAAKYEKIVHKRKAAIRSKMWDPETEFFYSIDRDTHKKIMARTLQAFLTLTCGAATDVQAKALLKHLTNPGEFWSNYPIPTSALDDPSYDTKIGKQPPLMWRGDVWPGTNYLVSIGLQKYGFQKTAEELTSRMMKLLQLSGINERYHPLTGKAMGTNDLGMSCSIWSMIVQNYYGLQDDFRTIKVPSDAEGKELKCGKIEFSYPTSHSVKLKSVFAREMNVVIPVKPANGISLICDGMGIKTYSYKNNTISFLASPDKEYQVLW